MIYRDMHGKSMLRLRNRKTHNIDFLSIFEHEDKIEFEKAQKKSAESEKDVRGKVQKIITEGVFFGEPILQILEELNSSENYKEYSEYFEQWINDRKNKKEEMLRFIEKQEENGMTIGQLRDDSKFSKRWKNYQKYYIYLLEKKANEAEKESQTQQEEK